MLLRVALRKDRVRLSVWVGLVVLLAFYCVDAVKAAYPNEGDLAALLGFVQGPAGVAMTGPGYGLDTPTYATVFAGVYALYVYLAVAFMGATAVVRHTRADEESGRSELIGAGAVGRFAPLTAAGVVAMGASLVTGVGIVGATWSYGSAADAWLLGACAASVGIVFAGIAAVAAQLAERARSAMSMASAVIGAAVVVRGVGDIMREHGSWLSWFSPFAWAQQTRPFAEPRWWPLLVPVVVAACLWAASAVLLARRDMGAGLVAQRPGRSHASRWLAGPYSLALRLERGSIIGWSLGVGFSGLLYGSLAASVQESLANLPQNLKTVLLAQDGDLVDAYAATMAFFDALLVACFAIVAVHRLASEEAAGRAEVVLAAAVSRRTWVGASVVAALVGSVVVTLAGGLGLGIAVGASLGDSSRVWPLVLAQAAYLPAVAVVIGVTAALASARPRWVSAAWALVGWGMFAGFFGQLVSLPQAALNASPFHSSTSPGLRSSRSPPLRSWRCWRRARRSWASRW